jgi:hypothetical protein
VPGLLPLEQHGTASQIQSSCLELSPQGVVSPTIADHQLRQASLQLAAQSEMAAEGAATVVHEREGHCAILAIAALMP